MTRPPSDPEYDPESWLDPMQRGSLLHALYEQIGTAFHGRQHELAADAARDRVLVVTDQLLAEYRDKVPPLVTSGQLVVRETVREWIDQAVAAFIDLLRGGNTGKMIVKLADDQA